MSWDRERIVSLLFRAGAIARECRADLRRELKRDRTLVTRADREIEALFVRELERPEAGTYLIGEETVETRGEAYLEAALREECYVVDPIDGTIPYAYGLPFWGISIGRMEASILTDGAVYLPEAGDVFASEGERVQRGIQSAGGWEWTWLDGPRPEPEPLGLLAVTQAVAKRGKVLLPNPVLVLGAAVVPMAGLLHGQFLAYLGSVKLWDVAGALPLLLRRGFSASVRTGDEIVRVTARVDERAYHLRPESPVRWKLRSDLLICHPGDEARLRAALVCDRD